MASEGNFAKICTFICFNIFYLICVAIYIFKLISLYVIKATYEFEIPPSYGSMLTILVFVVISMIFVAIFGFVAFCVDKPMLYIAYAIMLLVCMGLQITSGVVNDKAAFDLAEYQIKFTILPNFTFLQSELQKPIQRMQQENDCCAYGTYKEYYIRDSNDLEQSWLIPDSCCGKYDLKRYWATGACSFEEYSTKKGCGTLMRDVYLDYAREEGPKVDVKGAMKVSWTFLIIFCVMQVFSVLSAFYAFLQTRAQASNTGIIYGGAATTYR